MTAAFVVAGALLATAGGLKPAGPSAAKEERPASAGQTHGGLRRFDIGGELSVLFDWLPRREVRELRQRLTIDLTVEPAPWLRLRAEGLAEGLVADRNLVDRVEDSSAVLREGWVEILGNRADLRVGYGRLVWGRLDEVQPSDVINPLDVTKFLLEGRSEARLPVQFVRGRVYPAEGFSIEGVVVPRFEHGTYDVLDERTSPFNLLRDVVLPAGTGLSTDERAERPPAVDWTDPLGGVRLSVTAGRVDVSVSAFEGADGFGVVTFEPEEVDPISLAVVGRLVETYSRFRMYAADFETVTGEWAIRGEVAAFVEKQLAGVTVPGTVTGRVIDAGIGFDRRAGGVRVYATGLYHREWSDEDPGVERSDVSVLGSVDRSFARDTQLVRAFAVVNPVDRSAFLRGLWSWNTSDNTTLEISGGAFLGASDDTLGRFKGRDFVFTRFRWRF